MRNLIDTLFASPVMAASVAISLCCASILVVKLMPGDAVSNGSSDMPLDPVPVSTPRNDYPGQAARPAPASPHAADVDDSSPEGIWRTTSTPTPSHSTQRPPTRQGPRPVQQNIGQNYNVAVPVENYDDHGEGTVMVPATVQVTGTRTATAAKTSTPGTTSTDPGPSKSSPSDDDDDQPLNPDDGEPPETPAACSDSPTLAMTDHTLKIDLDETQTISCRAIDDSCLPCLCTLTTTDEAGSRSEIINNCT